MRKRGLCCHPVSVCPSVTLVHCIQTAEDIVIFLSRTGSSIIPVFDPERQYLIPRETLKQKRKIHVLEKFCNFRLKSPFILETVRDRPMASMER